MKKIKACAARFEAYGEEFSAMDIKLQLGLDVCTTTINNALKEPDKVRWGIAWANEGTGAQARSFGNLECSLPPTEHTRRGERHLQLSGVCVVRVMFHCSFVEIVTGNQLQISLRTCAPRDSQGG